MKKIINMTDRPFYWIDDLTRNERELLRLASKGMQRQEIARELGVRRSTVWYWAKSALDKVEKFHSRRVELYQIPGLLLELIRDEAIGSIRPVKRR